MKKIALTMAAMGLAATANASITINWFSGNGIDHPLGGPLPAGALVQLIWTPDNIIGTLDPFNPTATEGNDILLQDNYNVLPGAFAYGDQFDDGVGPLAGVTEATLLSGYVYVRVFSTAAPAIGDYYGVSQLIGNPLNDADPPPGIPDFLDISPIQDTPFNSWIQIVPEPSVLALAALGAAVVAVRRFRRS